MRNYLDLAYDVLVNGEKREDRTGTGTLSVFSRQLKYNLAAGFPAVTTKRLFIKGVWVELLWMLSGSTSAKFMLDNNVHIWDEWMNEKQELGRVYGVQWRQWKGKFGYHDSDDYPTQKYIDQLAEAIEKVKNNPTDRRMLVLAWNPGEIDEMALPPCHYAFQLYVREGNYLDIQVQQRSADVFLGLPFDIASYATLVHMIAWVTDKIPGELTYNLGDTHIYLDHVEQVKEQIFRKPYPLPVLDVNYQNREITSIDDFKLSDLHLYGYKHHPKLEGNVSV